MMDEMSVVCEPWMHFQPQLNAAYQQLSVGKLKFMALGN